MKSLETILGSGEPIVVDESVSVLLVVQRMSARAVEAAAVVDQDGRLTGIFTDRDVSYRIVAAGLDPASTPVGRVMAPVTVVADMRERCDLVLQRMLPGRTPHLVVVDGGRVAGVLTLGDLLEADLTEKTSELDFLQAYVHDVPSSRHAKPPA